MERLKLRYQVFMQTLKTLKEPLEALSDTSNCVFYKMVRDSLIQRFEYSYEALWQLLKEYLSSMQGIEVKSPREIFAESQRIGFITQEELQHLLRMITDRNQTSHAYQEKAAEIIAEHIQDHFKLMKILAERVSKKINK